MQLFKSGRNLFKVSMQGNALAVVSVLQMKMTACACTPIPIPAQPNPQDFKGARKGLYTFRKLFMNEVFVVNIEH